ncbi:hypothetical protein GX50_07551 [[Emmonsia] crescens]|uniref:DRBM domain-containing protein n=2 Tax=[Emmonsia] crescens TaxID=73230 RepID=A0A0G2HY92_9EURO|nr:hypothetical protein EMCG_02579 [Emmonsia crescens UAMH 3008]PGH29697.1 hypothetical protein GX50_07551 [Emmonsia crescens]
MASLAAANPAARTNGVQRVTWQEKLQGGRTAWSSTVTIQGSSFAARYFYDGQNTNNAKEDAAEVALTALRSQGGSPTTSFPGQLYAQNQPANSFGRWN